MDSFNLSDIFFFLIWFAVISQMIFSRRGRKNKRVDLPEEKEDIPENLPQKSPESNPAPVKQGSPDNYDFDELRKRIRDAWGMGENQRKKPAEMDLPDEMEREVYKEEPLIVADHAETTPAMNPYQEYLLRKTEKKPESKMPLPKEVVTEIKREKEEWNEEAAKKWIIYDAVFGAPRSKNVWKPFTGRE